MSWRLKPRDDTFFEQFCQAGQNLVAASTTLQELLAAPPPGRAPLARRLSEVEHRGDELTHAVLHRLNRTFVTPFDRADIYALASAIDDCLDEMEDAGVLADLYRVADLPSGVLALAEVVARQARCTAAAMPRLRTLSRLEEYWIEINRLENEGDRIYRSVLAELFGDGREPVEILKVKEVVDALEAAADAFETVSHHVETIAVKES